MVFIIGKVVKRDVIVNNFMFYIQCYSIVLMCYNVISLGEVADFGKIKFQLKNKYDAKGKYE